MKPRTRKSIGRIVFMIVTVAGISTAWADMAPIPEILELTQEGADVEIKTVVTGTGTVVIEREQAEKKTTVVEMETSDVTQTVEYYCEPLWESGVPVDALCEAHPDDCHTCEEGARPCVGESCDDCMETESNDYVYPEDLSAFCETYPEYALDCDDDGIAECCMGTCEEIYFVYFVDQCVPPGETTYAMMVSDYVSQLDLVVEESDACQSETDSDTESDIRDTETEATEDTETQAADTETEATEDTETQAADTETEATEDTGVEEEDSETETENSEQGDTETDISTDSDDNEADADSSDKDSGCQVVVTGIGAHSKSLFELMRSVLTAR